MFSWGISRVFLTYCFDNGVEALEILGFAGLLSN
jgi:hypothetical protein